MPLWNNDVLFQSSLYRFPLNYDSSMLTKNGTEWGMSDPTLMIPRRIPKNDARLLSNTIDDKWMFKNKTMMFFQL